MKNKHKAASRPLLTIKEQELYALLVSYKGKIPSQAKLAEDLGAPHRQAVNYLLKRLILKGYVQAATKSISIIKEQ
jgi:DNA-binding response OmpR family regulator